MAVVKTIAGYEYDPALAGTSSRLHEERRQVLAEAKALQARLDRRVMEMFGPEFQRLGELYAHAERLRVEGNAVDLAARRPIWSIRRPRGRKHRQE